MLIANYLFGFFAISAYFITPTVARQAIVGGHIAKADQFPYQISLQLNNRHICGGGIITAEFILTAAHCVVWKDDQINDERYFVLAGTHDLIKPVAPDEYVRVKTIYVTKEFSYKKGVKFGDIAVLKLVHPLDVKPHGHIQKLRLPLAGEVDFHGQHARIAGFGSHRTDGHPYNVPGGKFDNRLRFANVHVLDTAACLAQMSKLTEINENIICGRVDQEIHGHPSGVCKGDSGSPLVNEYHVVIGILSHRGPDCEENVHPGLYTNVGQYRNFIISAVQGDEDPNILRKLDITS